MIVDMKNACPVPMPTLPQNGNPLGDAVRMPTLPQKGDPHGGAVPMPQVGGDLCDFSSEARLPSGGNGTSAPGAFGGSQADFLDRLKMNFLD